MNRKPHMTPQQTTTPIAVRDDGELLGLMGARLAEGEVPARVVVVPWGAVESSAGSFVVDAESGREVVAAFDGHGTDLPIDYEHQTLGGAYASPEGKAPAAGWITALEAIEGEGIVASVTWTAEGREMLATKEYRYLSPVALIRKRDRKLIGLHSAALTNKPAIVGMEALVNRSVIGAAVGAAVGAAGGAAVGAIVESSVESSVDTASAYEAEIAELAALSEKLDVPVEDGTQAVLVAAHRRITALETDAKRRDAEERIVDAQRSGKLTEAQRAWAMDLAMEHPDLYDAWAQSAPVVVPLGRSSGPGNAGAPAENQRMRSIAARTEYRACKSLHGLTSEDAFVADALRHRMS